MCCYKFFMDIIVSTVCILITYVVWVENDTLDKMLKQHVTLDGYPH